MIRKSEISEYCIINSIEEYEAVRNSHEYFVLCPRITLNIFEQNIIVDNFSIVYTRKFLDKYLKAESFLLLNMNLVSRLISKDYVIEPKELVSKDLFFKSIKLLKSKRKKLLDILFVTENLYRDIAFSFEEKKRREVFRDGLLKKINDKNLKKSTLFTSYDKKRLLKIKGTSGDYQEVSKKMCKFSIVCTVYNDEGNISQFLKMINEIEYPRHLFEVILVDDGSSDQTSDIEKQALNSPVNIKYIQIEHIGVSEARNVALKHVNNEYLLFTDFDDILSRNILFESNLFFITYPQVNILCSPIYLLDGENRALHNLSKAKYSTRIRYTIFDLEEKQDMYLSNVAGTVIKKSLVENIKFVKDLNFFEDTSWINNVVNANKITKYGFANESYYEYIRSSNTSLISKRYENQEQVALLIKEYIYSLSNYKLKSSVIATLKSINWFLGDALINTKKKISDENIGLLRELAKLIDQNHMEYLVTDHVASAVYLLQGLNYKQYQEYQTKDHVIKYYVSCNLDKSFDLAYTNEIFIFDKKIGYEIKSYEQSKSNIKRPITSILLMDRIFMPEDNAYYLYKYLKETTDLDLYFVLSDKSSQWEQLLAEGVNLVKYGSQEYRDLIVNVDCIMSSHADKYIMDYGGLRTNILDQTFVFLQHGVTNNNIKNWLFNKKIDYICSTFEFETELINLYFSKEQIIECGMPRLDYLTSSSDKYITYFTSWSTYLQELSNEEFIQSGFFKRILNVLNSKALQGIAQDNQLSIQVKVHPNIEDKVKRNLSQYDLTISSLGYDELITSSYMAFTDFSSVIFDMLYTTKYVYFYNDSYHEYFCERKIEQSLSYDDFEIERVSDIDLINDYIQESVKKTSQGNNCKKLCEELGV